MIWASSKKRNGNARKEVLRDDGIAEHEVAGALQMAQEVMRATRARLEASQDKVAALGTSLAETEDALAREGQARAALETAVADADARRARSEEALDCLQAALFENKMELEAAAKEAACLTHSLKQTEAARDAADAQAQSARSASRAKDRELKSLRGRAKRAERRAAEAEAALARQVEAAEARAAAGDAASVQAAALTLAQALAHSGFAGLETEANATASAARNLAEALALGPAPPAATHLAYAAPPRALSDADSCITPTAHALNAALFPPGSIGDRDGFPSDATAEGATPSMGQASPWVGGALGRLISWSASKALGGGSGAATPAVATSVPPKAAARKPLARVPANALPASAVGGGAIEKTGWEARRAHGAENAHASSEWAEEVATWE